MWFVLTDDEGRTHDAEGNGFGSVYVDSLSFKRDYYEDFLRGCEMIYMSALALKENELGAQKEASED